MNATSPVTTQQIEKTILINAPAITVWAALTEPTLMKQWMAEPEMALEITTSWIVGEPILMRGHHHITFENRGTVRHVEPPHHLRYAYLSSISHLSDRPEHYSTIDFRLTPLEEQTTLVLTLSNFPTLAIYKHVDFYWQVALTLLKKLVEQPTPLASSNTNIR